MIQADESRPEILMKYGYLSIFLYRIKKNYLTYKLIIKNIILFYGIVDGNIILFFLNIFDSCLCGLRLSQNSPEIT